MSAFWKANKCSESAQFSATSDSGSILLTAFMCSSTTLEVLGRSRRQLQDWFDDNDADISNILVEKNGLHKAYMDRRTDVTKAAFFRYRRLVQQRLREMQDAWMIRKAKGNPGISSGIAPGSDAIPPEVYKHSGPRLVAKLTTLFQEMRHHVQVLQDFNDATIVHLYRRKGNRQLCDNHRGISLLNITGKIFALIHLNRLSGHLKQSLLPESQCGFRRHRGTTDMIFADRQLQEKFPEMLTHPYTTFVDPTKAFDTVNRDGLWKVMQKFGCPERFTHMMRQLHDGMTARVTDNGTISEAFAVSA
ncbi:unnamed protein product [Schistocephalus solidus]|uniref:Reverse transcriptase domain-containing protein n=1 Tax=Schistocephalus solidus TaxID=70667 RepID=A0A183SHM4_SCHSO|nr:unnamed protein product [Schistocephalus solidus]